MFVVDVAVALRRPPREDRWSRIVLDAPTHTAAMVHATHWAARRKGVVMPVTCHAALLDATPDPADVDTLTARLRAAAADARAPMADTRRTATP